MYIFLWETFEAFAPKAVEFPTVEMEETMVRGVRSKDGAPPICQGMEMGRESKLLKNPWPK